MAEVDIKYPAYKAKQGIRYNVRVARLSQIPDNLDNVENLYIPLNFEENLVENVKKLPVSVGVEVPRGIFGNEIIVEKYLQRAKKCENTKRKIYP